MTRRLMACGFAAGLALLAFMELSVPLPAQADSIRNREWIISALRLAEAHRTTDGKGTVVAVIDTGVQADHPDLTGNILDGADFNPQATKGVGHDDINGHGTGVAGLIAGHGHGTRHQDGVIGVAPEAKILPVRDGGTIQVGIVPAIRWAVAHGAQVICLAQDSPVASTQEEHAIEEAEREDVVVVAAAGSKPRNTAVGYPARYAGVVAAAGTDERGSHSEISVAGSQVVLAAPSDNIVLPCLHTGYGLATGTSASTAIIAGAAALVRSRFPKLSAVEVIHRLTATAIDKGPPGRDDEYGYGLIDIVAALTANVPPLAGPSASPSASPLSSIGSGSPAAHTPPLPSSSPSTAGGERGTSPIPFIVAALALFAVIGVWVAARRRTPG